MRREVRLAGAAVLLVAPVGLAFSSFQTTVTAEPGGVPARLTGVEGFTGAEEGIAPVLPMAPGLRVPVPACEADAPVVLPGYVLPDDGTEEPAHAGG